MSDNPHPAPAPPPPPETDDGFVERIASVARRRISVWRRVAWFAALLVVGVVVIAFLSHILTDWLGLYYGEQSDGFAAEIQMSNFGQAIDNYRLTYEQLPNSLQELTKPADGNPHPFIQSIPTDPWGNDYEYRVIDRATYQILSYGEDGQPGTEDDIVHPRR